MGRKISVSRVQLWTTNHLFVCLDIIIRNAQDDRQNLKIPLKIFTFGAKKPTFSNIAIGSKLSFILFYSSAVSHYVSIWHLIDM